MMLVTVNPTHTYVLLTALAMNSHSVDTFEFEKLLGRGYLLLWSD